MEEIKDYKNEIAATRIGCLGSSDGKMLAQIAELGFVPKSAYKRLAVVKGLIPQEEIPKNAAIQAGDDLEMIVFSNLKLQDQRYESNPLWVSKTYSKQNCKLISHPDIVLQDDTKKVLNVYEVKTTKFSFEQTRTNYQSQLFIHYLLATERAKKLGKDWKVKVCLVHYSTDGLDLTNGIEFDESRLTIHQVYFSTMYFDISKAMCIVNDFLETFNEYYDGDEIDANLLPENVKMQFESISNVLVEIKERENIVNEFKKRLYDFMLEKDIKSIKNEAFTISRVDPSVSKSFDSKKYLADLAKKYPRKSKKIISEYSKETKRSGYAIIKVKNNNNNN